MKIKKLNKNKLENTQGYDPGIPPRLVELCLEWIAIKINNFVNIYASPSRDILNPEELVLLEPYNLARLNSCGVPNAKQILEEFLFKKLNTIRKFDRRVFISNVTVRMPSIFSKIKMDEEKDVPEKFLREYIFTVSNNQDNESSFMTTTRINRSCESITDIGMMHLSSWMLKSESIVHLALTACQIGNVGAVFLASALRASKSIKVINVGNNMSKNHAYDNFISNPGTIAISLALGENSSLDTLILDGNPIEEAGGISLAKTMESTTSLKRLSIRK